MMRRVPFLVDKVRYRVYLEYRLYQRKIFVVARQNSDFAQAIIFFDQLQNLSRNRLDFRPPIDRLDDF